MPIINTKQILIIGFGSIFSLMILIAVIATDQMQLTLISVEHIVKNNNTKTNLISSMLVAARERTISLQKMTRMEDPFERDEEWMRFNSHGAKFKMARQKFVEMETSPEEDKILKIQGALTNRVVPVQIKIARMAITDQFAEAEALLRSHAMPDQDQVFVQLYKLLNLLENESNKTVLNVSNS